MLRLAQLLWLSMIWFVVPAAASELTTAQAKDHIGEQATVCGIAAGSHYARNSHGAPTFVNLDKAYPHQVFTILIWGEDLRKFNPGPSTWSGKRVCVSGAVESYREMPEIVVHDPTQIKLP